MMDSWSLRLWILLAGLVVIAGIYGWSKWQERRREGAGRTEAGKFGKGVADDWDVIPVLTEKVASPRRHAPLAEDELAGAVHNAAPTMAEQPAAESYSTSVHEDPPAPVKELILTLTVLAPHGRQYGGSALIEALEQAGMVFGAMRIFHAPADLERPDGPALFSLANILEPGTLESERLRHLETPGVILFAQLPGPVNGLEVYEHMQSTGRYLVRELGGELCDERRRPLSPEKIEETRSRILSEIGDIVRRPDF